MDVSLLPDGLVLRAARPADGDQIAALVTARGDAADGIDARLVLGDERAGPDTVAVVVDGDRVVSTLTLLEESVTIAAGTVAVTLPTGQVELVATDPAYEGRGLVRALMGWAHERSRRQGHLLQLMVGIPYFYRRFGYVYGLAMATRRRLRDGWTASPAGAVTVRPATPADIPVLARLQDEAQAASAVRMPHSAACWDWLLARTGTVQLIAEAGAQPVGAARCTAPEDDVVVISELAATTSAAAEALLGFAMTAGDGAAAVHADERPGTVAGSVVAAAGHPASVRPDWYYVRVPDVVALLEALRPVLSARVAAAHLDGDPGGAGLISFYESSLTFPWSPRGVGPFTAGGVVQAPVSRGGSGVPPDAVAALVLGDGAAGVERRFPDANLGRQRELMTVLFPPVQADVLTFYLP